MVAARPEDRNDSESKAGRGAAPQTHSLSPAHLWLALVDVPAAATDSWAPAEGMRRGSHSWKGETGGALPAGVWRPPPLEEGQAAEVLFRLQPCPSSTRLLPSLDLTCDVQQLQLPALASEEQRPRAARAGWRQQLGQQGSRGEAVVPLQHGHQREAFIHQVE